MPQDFFLKLASLFFFGFVPLVGVIWRLLNERIRKVEKTVVDLAAHEIRSDIAQIRTDIQWIKQFIIKQ